MNAEQLLKQVGINRGLIVRGNNDAYEHLDTLQKEYSHLINEEIAVSIEMNKSLMALIFNANYAAALDNSVAALDNFKNATCNVPISLHLKMVGFCYAHMGDYDQGERYLLEALDTVGDSSPVTRADILHALAMVQDFKDPHSIKLVHYLTEAMELVKGTEDEDIRRANCIMGIGNYYNNIGEAEKALINFKLALETFEKEYRLPSMGNCYSNMGSCYLKLNDIANAELCLEKSLELRLKFGSPDELCIAYFNLATLNYTKKNYTLCEDFLYKALKLAEESGNKPSVNRINNKLDEISQVKRQLKAA